MQNTGIYIKKTIKKLDDSYETSEELVNNFFTPKPIE